jgi:hypothetical protein
MSKSGWVPQIDKRPALARSVGSAGLFPAKTKAVAGERSKKPATALGDVMRRHLVQSACQP